MATPPVQQVVDHTDGVRWSGNPAQRLDYVTQSANRYAHQNQKVEVANIDAPVDDSSRKEPAQFSPLEPLYSHSVPFGIEVTMNDSESLVS
jgi:hypothetical protein